MSVPMKFSPTLGQAIADCDQRLLQIQQILHHTKAMMEPLAWMQMTTCAKLAGQIHSDLKLQYRTGDLVARMRETLKKDYPAVFGSQVDAELIRQFIRIAVVFYEMDSDEEESEYGQKILADHAFYMEAATAAVTEKSI